MSAFLTDLDRRHIRGPRNRLLADLVYYSQTLGRHITVPMGFEYDGMSVPWWMVFHRGALVDVGHKASAVHDWLYANPGLCTRSAADATFREALRVEGGGWFVRNYAWLGVRAGGWRHYGKRPPPLPPIEPDHSSTGD